MMRESDSEAYLVKRVKELGGEVRKVKWIGRNGAPDRIVMIPRYGIAHRTIWVELKAEGLAALFPHTPHERQQHREHVRMRNMGQVVVVVDSFAGVDALLS
jgi:hypothetical protein